jgi:hypothetical protein
MQQRVDKLTNMKNFIEKMDNSNQIEVLRLLHNHSVVLNENKNGIYINLSELDEDIIDQIYKFVNYIHNQENKLSEEESEKQCYKNIYFDNKDK